MCNSRVKLALLPEVLVLTRSCSHAALEAGHRSRRHQRADIARARHRSAAPPYVPVTVYSVSTPTRSTWPPARWPLYCHSALSRLDTEVRGRWDWLGSHPLWRAPTARVSDDDNGDGAHAPRTRRAVAESPHPFCASGRRCACVLC